MKKRCPLPQRMFFACVFLLTISQLSLYAQKPASRIVDGVVSNEKGEALQGVVVEVKNSNTRTLTDRAGKFSIAVAGGKNAELVLTYTGYADKEVKLTESSSNLNLVLSPDTKALDDIVVVGYAAVKKKDVTGSVAGISQTDIRSRPVANALQAMQGKVAGVDITSNERPGQVGSITIRGVRSLTASNSPLFVVDGIPLMTGGIDNINPNDIESIDILKDASATAIYGSRGANGVVIVSTKQGKAGKAVLSLNSSVTMENLRDKAPIMNASDYITFRRWAYYYSNPALYPRGDQPNITNDQKIFLATSDPSAWSNIARGWAGGTWDGSKVMTTDWGAMVKQTGITTDQTISVSGGSDKIKAYASFGYLNNKGTAHGQQFTRYSAKSSVDINPTNWFSMGSNINVSYSVQEFGQSTTGATTVSSSSGIYESSRALFRYAVPYDSLGNRIQYPGGDVAFKTVADEWNFTQDQRVTLRAFGSLYAQVNLGSLIPALKGLRYRLNFGPDFSYFRDGIYVDGQSVISSGANFASLSKNQTFSYTLDNLLYYDRVFNKHSVGLTLLQSVTKYNFEASAIAANGIPFSSQKWNALTQANIPSASLSSYSSSLTEKQLLSYMARLNYGFTDKYLLTVSARLDGASQLAEGHKYSLFPSAALAWRVNRENFMRQVSWINDLKLRLGAGVTGNSAIDPYATKGAVTPLFYPFVTNITSGSLPSSVLANQSLGWEKTTQYNLGIDFSLFNRRVSGTIDAYTSDTKELLMQRSIPTVTGYSTTYANIGQTANKGVDFSLSTINISNRNFQWATTLNVTWQKSRIVSLSNGKQNDINNNWFIGQPIGVIYGYQSAGLWRDSVEMNKFNANGSNFTPGNIRPVDQNGDYKIDANNDRVIIGNTRPTWVVGMTNSFSYKGFELSVFLYGRLGYMFSTGGEAQVGRSNQRQIDYYTELNKNSEWQKPIYTTATGDLYTASLGYRNASFIKIRNISMAYTFTGNALKKMGMSSLRAYFQVANPGMLFSKIKWLDMDINSASYNRGFTFGINAGF
ncbi:SusC/RagA family TonB-linked outer membrane protein [Sediminibacterium soli]|uniref:SusC/RagA family TonB-linked outer membrane protein n=1 Tax=Sediminibacterium soli TaxID=2698829 RepID=UPI0013799DF2|nr:TonB-dependent receptor [Sediminibacterium soli]NCI45296.1 TonB-dependent receptor [Sediminibacterium soli]